MKAKITKAEGWKVFIEGRTVVYPQGAILEGELAKLAIAGGAASTIAITKAKKAPENKATKPAMNKEAD